MVTGLLIVIVIRNTYSYGATAYQMSFARLSVKLPPAATVRSVPPGVLIRLAAALAAS